MNETGGYSHHKIYEMKGTIEEIIYDKGYITEKHIKDVINYYLLINKNLPKSRPITFSEEQIFEHIVSNLHQLVKKHPREELGFSTKIHSNAFYTIKSLASRYNRNYPESTETMNL